tara:strand:- start:1276 stop:1395 length:120 start_codon:yes stop_codon:yes gene_type:complete
MPSIKNPKTGKKKKFKYNREGYKAYAKAMAKNKKQTTSY